MGGEARVRASATAKFIQAFPSCCFCAGARPATTREHMPPKSLFDRSHRPDKLVVPACEICNSQTSTADLTAAIISRWGEAQSDQIEDHHRLAARMKKQAPDLVEEWIGASGAILNRNGRRHLRAQGVSVPDGASIVRVGPATIRQLNLFAHKATLALYFEHFRKYLTSGGAYCAFWRTKEDYAAKGMPDGLLDLLPTYATLIQGTWSAHETFEYRYAVSPEGLLGFLAKLREGLFVSGFALADATQLPPNDESWVRPGELLAILDSPGFDKRA